MHLRQILRKTRRALSVSARETAAYGVFSQFLKLPFLSTIEHVAVYAAFDGEIDAVLIIQWCWENQKHCYLPRLMTPTEKNYNSLQFLTYQKNSLLKLNKFNIPEPEAGEGVKILTPANLDLILLPLVAFDRQGHRLGMGKGFYDNTLKPMNNRLKKPFLLGMGYDFQCVDNIVPHENDVSMDGILTDKEMILLER